jgi:hypothetical protein
MIRARVRALLVAGAVLAVALLVFAMEFQGSSPKPLSSRPPEQRPELLLLTSLPLVFGESFSLRQSGSPALKALESRYKVEPISVSDPPELAKAKLLLMAHPPAQPAEDLVALDDWVRAGGRVLLLADPRLEWPSERPLGDSLRPPAMFMDTGLLAHWGLRLDAPDRPGPSRGKLGGYEILTVSPGQLFGTCDISPDRLVARCKLGKGRATVVADADFLDAERLGPDAAHNFDGLLKELADLEHV